MSEYVGEFKVGTCENLYYVRYTDLLTMQNLGIECSEYLDEKHGFRYRFPFPDEDSLNYQNDEYYDNGFDRVFPLPIPQSWADEYNTGFCGIRQQKMVDGQLRVVLTLGEGSGNVYSIDEEDARELFDFLDSQTLLPAETKMLARMREGYGIETAVKKVSLSLWQRFTIKFWDGVTRLIS